MSSTNDRNESESAPAAHEMPAHLSVVSGLLMGGADAIPGVSGGTIALILGIYDRFVESLNTVVRAPFYLRPGCDRTPLWRALRFLLPLGLGIAIAYLLVTKLLVGKSESPGLMIRPESAPYCYAFFFGLVLVSIREPWRHIENTGSLHYLLALLGCAAAAVFAGLPHASAAPEKWMLFLGGAAAISVMILPGVSGSLLLVILGQYQAVVNALHDKDLVTFGVFLLGIVAGVISFVPALRYVLARHHNLTMATLTGLMAGSLRALWPWKDSYDMKTSQLTNAAPGEHIAFVVLAALAGGAVVFLLAMLERRIEAVEASKVANV